MFQDRAGLDVVAGLLEQRGQPPAHLDGLGPVEPVHLLEGLLQYLDGLAGLSGLLQHVGEFELDGEEVALPVRRPFLQGEAQHGQRVAGAACGAQRTGEPQSGHDHGGADVGCEDRAGRGAAHGARPVAYQPQSAHAHLLGVLGQRTVLGAQPALHGAAQGFQVDQFGSVGDPVAQDGQQFAGEGGVPFAVGGQCDPVARGCGEDVRALHGGLRGEPVLLPREGGGGPAAEAAVEDDHLAPGPGVAQGGAQVLVGDGGVADVLARALEGEVEVGGRRVPHAVPGVVDQQRVGGLLPRPVDGVEEFGGVLRVEHERAVLLGQPPDGRVAQLGGQVLHIGLDGRERREVPVRGAADDDRPGGRGVRQSRHRPRPGRRPRSGSPAPRRCGAGPRGRRPRPR